MDASPAIIVGITVGAVSTIFVATPLLVGLMERDPEYAGRVLVLLHDGALSAAELDGAGLFGFAGFFLVWSAAGLCWAEAGPAAKKPSAAHRSRAVGFAKRIMG